MTTNKVFLYAIGAILVVALILFVVFNYFVGASHSASYNSGYSFGKSMNQVNHAIGIEDAGSPEAWCQSWADVYSTDSGRNFNPGQWTDGCTAGVDTWYSGS